MMKKKILKAISEAVYNVLSTDIIDQDIDFDNTDVNNEYIAIDNLTADFLSNPQKDILDNIIDIYITVRSISIRYKHLTNWNNLSELYLKQ